MPASDVFRPYVVASEVFGARVSAPDIIAGRVAATGVVDVVWHQQLFVVVWASELLTARKMSFMLKKTGKQS